MRRGKATKPTRQSDEQSHRDQQTRADDPLEPELSVAERLLNAEMAKFTPESARYALYGNILLRLLVLAYCVRRFESKLFDTRLELFLAVDAFATLFFAALFKDLQQAKPPRHFFRLVAATFYGACHPVVLLNIIDRTFERNGFWSSTFACIAVGSNTMRDFINFYGFKLKKALFDSLKDRTAKGAYCRARIVSGLVQLAGLLWAAVEPYFVRRFVAVYMLSAVVECVFLEIGLCRVRVA